MLHPKKKKNDKLHGNSLDKKGESGTIVPKLAAMLRYGQLALLARITGRNIKNFSFLQKFARPVYKKKNKNKKKIPCPLLYLIIVSTLICEERSEH